MSTSKGWSSQSSVRKDLESSNIEAIPQDTNHSSVVRIGRRVAKKYRDEAQKFWNKVLWTDETKIDLLPKWWKSQSVEKEGICSWSKTYKLICEARWRKCHGLGSHGCFWSGSLIFTDDVTHDDSSRMNSEVYKKHSAYRETCPN